MNYIHQLQTDIETLSADSAAKSERIAEFRAYLSLPKFTEPGTDGTRSDWISTADVMRWLQYIENPEQTV
jgi:hypothetical protein